MTYVFELDKEIDLAQLAYWQLNEARFADLATRKGTVELRRHFLAPHSETRKDNARGLKNLRARMRGPDESDAKKASETYRSLMHYGIQARRMLNRIHSRDLGSRAFRRSREQPAFMVFDFANDPHLVAPASSDKQKFFTFWHEAAHAIFYEPPPVGTYAERKVRMQIGENLADCFAALHGLRRGILTVEDIETLASNRAANGFIFGDLYHVTTKALGLLLDDWKSGKLADLEPSQVMPKVRDYATRGAFTPAQMIGLGDLHARKPSSLVVKGGYNGPDSLPHGQRQKMCVYFDKMARRKTLRERFFTPAEPRLETLLAAKALRAMGAAP